MTGLAFGRLLLLASRLMSNIQKTSSPWITYDQSGRGFMLGPCARPGLKLFEFHRQHLAISAQLTLTRL